jgi:glycosyltransferase involved in cell wall biosynthesis
MIGMYLIQQFTKKFELPTEKCLVIKNGIENIEPISTIYKKGEPIKIIHQCTPWRGLSVLLGAMQLVKNPLITLDVYSSTEVYGKYFYKQNDHEYHELYDQAKKLKNVNYIGYKPNEYIKEHLIVYPSIWEETFCISALEAMAAGLYCVTTNYGALYETCAEFPMYIPYSNNYRSLARKFATGIEIAAKSLEAPGIRDHLKMQKDYVNQFYNWKVKGSTWTRFLQGAINAKQ